MRYTFGKTIADLIKQDPSIFVLCPDIGFGVFDTLRKECPDHFVNTGIAEQATVAMAAGMAQEGLKPWIYTITPFLLERPYEAIKLCVMNQKQNVQLVSFGDYPDLGPTHITSDLEGLCKCLKIPLMKPNSIEETIEMTNRMYESGKAHLMYLSKAKEK